jgi:hypothetical protein
VISKVLYASTQIPLVRPVFYVLYNGDDNFAEKKQYRLSEAFEKIPGNDDINLELVVNVINVNKGHNTDVLAACQPLSEYAQFVDKVREYKEIMRADPTIADPLSAAIWAAINYCIENNILRDFLEQHKSEVFKMMTYEYNLDDAKKVWVEEGHIDIARSLLNDGFDVERTARLTELPLATVQSLCRTAQATA